MGKEKEEFKYSEGVWNRRFWKNMGPNLAAHEADRQFTSKQVSDIIMAMLKTMDYELLHVAPVKELKALQVGTKFLHDEVHRHLYTSPIRHSDQWEKVIKVAAKLKQVAHSISFERQAVLKADEFYDKAQRNDEKKGKK